MKVEKIKQNAFVKKVGFNRIVLIFVLLLMYLAFGALTGGSFFGFSRIMNTLNYVYFLGFLSLGVTFVIATGGIDFSIGPVMYCCALVAGYCLTTYGVPMAPSLIMSILIGVLFGVFNGYLVAYWKVPPFIVSMASMNIAKGIAAVFTKTQSVSWPQSTTDDGWYRNFINMNGIPVGLFIFLGVSVICAIVLNKTKWGRYILCLGSNEEAVRRNGWYIHGRRACIHQWYCNWCIYHFSFTARYSCTGIYKGISVYYHRFDRYCGGLCRCFRKTQEELVIV